MRRLSNNWGKNANYTMIAFFMLVTCMVFGQRRNGQQVQALKIAFITQELKLSSSEAQVFWPLYNRYEDSMKKIKKEERATLEIFKNEEKDAGLKDEEANQLLESYSALEKEKLQFRLDFIQNLKPIFSSKKILKLFYAERNFHHRLIRQLKHGKKTRN